MPTLQAAADHPVLLIVFNGKHEVEAENLLASIKKNAHELLPYIHVCASDDKSKAFAQRHHLPWFALKNLERTGTYKTYDFNMFMRRKLEAILYFLRKGQDVLYVDTDIVFLGNPLPNINHKFDINIQNDMCSPPYSTANLCGGFMYVKANLTTISFLTSAIIEIIKCKYQVTDQCAINSLINRNKREISINILDACKFPNGCRYFQNTDPACKREQAIIVHNNYLIGIDNKMQRFKDNQLIFSDSE